MKTITRMFIPVVMTFALISGLATPLFAESQGTGYPGDDIWNFVWTNPVSKIAMTPIRVVKQAADYAGDNGNLGK